MKITNLTVQKEIEDGQTFLVCRATFDDGTEGVSPSPWHNQCGLWPSDADAREPAEIAAHLKSFAAAIERFVEQAKAA